MRESSSSAAAGAGVPPHLASTAFPARSIPSFLHFSFTSFSELLKFELRLLLHCSECEVDVTFKSSFPISVLF